MTTTATTATTPAPTPAPTSALALDLDPIAETLATIDVLIDRHVALTCQAARLKQELADLRAEQKLREAMLALDSTGRNETERHARLTLATGTDADYRRMVQAEREARLKLAETEAAAWAARQRLSVCLALLTLAVTDDDAPDAGPDAEEGKAAEGGEP